mgnify:CR=1 FL=1
MIKEVLQRAVQAVREANIPDGALPKVCISGCTSSCSGHQAAAIGFQGTVKAVPGGKPAPAFAIFLGGSDALGHAHFGDTIGTVYEEQLPALLVELGQAEVRNVFRITGVGMVAGCYVTGGKMQRGAQMRLLRDNIVIYDGAIASLQRFKDSVKEVAAGYECGITFEKFQDIKEGDVIEAFLMEQIEV